MIGGLVRYFFNKMKNEEKKSKATNDGILFCSGMIAGEGLIGIVLAILAIFGVDKFINISGMLNLPSGVSQILSLVVFALIILSLLMFSVLKKQKKAKQ